MRICSPHCGLDPETTSGGETYERELLLRLAGLGMHIDILLARHKRHPEGVRNWTIHRLPIGRGLWWPVAAFLLPPAIKRVHDRAGFEVLRVHSLRYIGPAALIARRRYRLDVPIVAHHHHLDADPLNRLIERRVIDRSERVITVSEFSRRQLATALGARTDHVEVVPNGVDERFAPGPKDPLLIARHRLNDRSVVLFLGGLKRRKNLPFLLDLWHEVVKCRPDATLLIAGGGPLEGSLKRRAEKLGLGVTVAFAGRVSEAEKVAYYNLADVMVSPSSLEGFGFTVAEAMSCGLPVVVSDQGALPELVVDGQSGFVCAGGDSTAFVRGLVRLLDDPILRRRCGGLNQERIDRHYRWERSSRRVAKIYEETLLQWKREAGAAMKRDAERFFRASDYWKAWSAVPDFTPDILYAIRWVRPSDRRVLDVPCGRGRLLKAIRAQAPAATLVGLDVNEEMVAQVRRDLPEVHAQVASVYAIPFRDCAFDTVLCHESFMHFDDPHRALAELCRVSSDRVYFSVTTRRQLNTLLRRIGLLGSSEVPHWTYNAEDLAPLLPDAFRWEVHGAFLIGHKALRLSHTAHARLHEKVGRHLPGPLLRKLGQTLFVYGSRRDEPRRGIR